MHVNVRVLTGSREIVFVAPKPVPPADQRAAWHRLLDDALDSFAATDAQPPSDPPGSREASC